MEEVISKETREAYFGCDSEKNPTCGIQHYELSDPMPFSEVCTNEHSTL